MKLTSKGRYAVTATLDIALHGENGPVNLADISSRQHISLSYLEQLFSKLRKKGLVHSVRGPGGGYKLGMPLDDISVGMIIDAVNENIKVTKCKGQGGCSGGKSCLTHTLWEDLSQQIAEYLHSVSLMQLVEQHYGNKITHKKFMSTLKSEL